MENNLLEMLTSAQPDKTGMAHDMIDSQISSNAIRKKAEELQANIDFSGSIGPMPMSNDAEEFMKNFVGGGPGGVIGKLGKASLTGGKTVGNYKWIMDKIRSLKQNITNPDTYLTKKTYSKAPYESVKWFTPAGKWIKHPKAYVNKIKKTNKGYQENIDDLEKLKFGGNTKGTVKEAMLKKAKYHKAAKLANEAIKKHGIREQPNQMNDIVTEILRSMKLGRN